MNKRTWGLQVLIIVVVSTLFFGLVAGERGVTLGLLVAAPAVLVPTLIWLRSRNMRGHREG